MLKKSSLRKKKIREQHRNLQFLLLIDADFFSLDEMSNNKECRMKEGTINETILYERCRYMPISKALRNNSKTPRPFWNRFNLTCKRKKEQDNKKNTCDSVSMAHEPHHAILPGRQVVQSIPTRRATHALFLRIGGDGIQRGNQVHDLTQKVIHRQSRTVFAESSGKSDKDFSNQTRKYTVSIRDRRSAVHFVLVSGKSGVRTKFRDRFPNVQEGLLVFIGREQSNISFYCISRLRVLVTRIVHHESLRSAWTGFGTLLCTMSEYRFFTR
ncbi:hypothetical protein NPIL_176271 [Nephila pilipes]|uniref:Uncharacterized protein n=1 Tax=Nephila pilipes TaxID=299642 RepID=A0A8X6TAF2_NEPPI|nr:hypothetical protein NPIL_176271 [Nephila pilipes]